MSKRRIAGKILPDLVDMPPHVYVSRAKLRRALTRKLRKGASRREALEQVTGSRQRYRFIYSALEFLRDAELRRHHGVDPFPARPRWVWRSWWTMPEKINRSAGRARHDALTKRRKRRKSRDKHEKFRAR
ncbi:MAG: hypothetical protein AAGD43_13425 [Pseudomonadota bacterium]